MAGSESLDQSAGCHQGPLDGGGQLPGNISERSQSVHVVRDAGEVVNIEIVLAIEDLEKTALIKIWNFAFCKCLIYTWNIF